MKIFITPSSDFINIAKALNTTEEYEFITMSPGFISALGNMDVKAVDLNSFLTQQEWVSVHVDALLLSAQMIDKVPRRSDLLPVESRKAVSLEDGALLADIGRRISDFVAMIRCLDVAKPALTIVHNDSDNTTRTIALWSKNNNVPCLHIPHSIYLDSDDRPDGDIHSILSASHAVASGPFHADWLIRNGMNPGNVWITGLPSFDKVAEKYNVDQMRRLLKVNSDFPVITYMSSWRQDTNLLGCHDGVEESYMRFLKAAKELVKDNAQIIVKCHPSGNNVKWHAGEAECQGVKCIVTDKHLGPIISVSDLIVSYGPSNVIIEAAIMNPMAGLVVIDGFCSDPEVSSITEDDDMHAAIAEELSGVTSKARFINKYVSFADGKSYERICDVIMSGILTEELK